MARWIAASTALFIVASCSTAAPPADDAAAADALHTDRVPTDGTATDGTVLPPIDATSAMDGTVAPQDAVAPSDAARPDAVIPPPDAPTGCGAACPANAHCVAMSCACDPGFVMTGAACTAPAAGDPATHSEADVCAHWREGRRVTAPAPFTMGTGGMCDPGSLSREALNDTLRRINAYRWMVGLGPVTDLDATNRADQECSLMESIRGFGPGNPDPHHPTADWTCYTAMGGAAAGMSNISWGTASAPDAVDNFMTDNGNETTMGHRRWILNPPLGPVGIGYYNRASCLGVLANRGGGTSGVWYAYPPPGPVPFALHTGYWTFHSRMLGLGAATVEVVRMADMMTMPIRRLTLTNGFGDPAIAWTNNGWRAASGDVFQVTISGLTGSATRVTYTTRAVTCP